MSYPKTTEEYWEYCEDFIGGLVNLISSYHPNAFGYPHRRKTMQITADNAEEACKQVRREIQERALDNPVEEFKESVEKRNGIRVATILNETWFGIPESYEAHSLPCFGLLCDLCSESYLVVVEEEIL